MTLRMHFVSIICLFITTRNQLIDFFFHSALTIFLYRCTTYIFVVVVKEHSKTIDKILLFLIENYRSPFFKLLSLALLTCYGILVLQFVIINNFLLIYILLQNFLIFVMDDLLFENREILIYNLRKLDCREKVKVIKPNEMKLIEDYIEKPKKIQARVRVSVREHVKKKNYFSITRFLWRKF